MRRVSCRLVRMTSDMGLVAIAALQWVEAHAVREMLDASHATRRTEDLPGNSFGAGDSMCAGDVDSGIARPASLRTDVAVPVRADANIDSITRSVGVIGGGRHADVLVSLRLMPEPWREGNNGCGPCRA